MLISSQVDRFEDVEDIKADTHMQSSHISKAEFQKSFDQ